MAPLLARRILSRYYEITSDTSLEDQLISQVRDNIRPFVSSKAIYIVFDLPKTRSSDIMRRILRKILADEQSQVSGTITLVDSSVVTRIPETGKQDHELLSGLF